MVLVRKRAYNSATGIRTCLLQCCSPVCKHYTTGITTNFSFFEKKMHRGYTSFSNNSVIDRQTEKQSYLGFLFLYKICFKICSSKLVS